jgi:ubiquinone biosynthesis protein
VLLEGSLRYAANAIQPSMQLDRAWTLAARLPYLRKLEAPEVRADWGRTLQRLADTAAVAPLLAFNAVRHGLLPSGVCAVTTLRREGLSELHWKVTGDALVRFFQHSGPLLTKFGQILATRNDVLPDAVCARLDALYTRQPPMTERQLDTALSSAFPEGLPFTTFGREALAIGSIAQAHRAQLSDGQRVIVKLVRPGIQGEIERDINVAHLLVDLLLNLPGYNRPTTRLAILRALQDLAAAFRSEADLQQEANALEEFGRRLRTNPRVRIPMVYRQWSSPGALVMEELTGEPLTAFRPRAKTDPDEARRVADLALKEILTQVFDDGRFHADPHAGNLLLLPDGRLGLIDLGLTGVSGEADRKRIARAVRAFISGDPDTLTRALLEFGTLPPDFNYDDFTADLLAVVRQQDQLLAHITGRNGNPKGPAQPNRLENFVNELFKVACRHGVYVPPSATLLIKTVVTIEGVARSLNPNINVIATAVPIVLRSMTPRWLKWRFWRS